MEGDHRASTIQYAGVLEIGEQLTQVLRRHADDLGELPLLERQLQENFSLSSPGSERAREIEKKPLKSDDGGNTAELGDMVAIAADFAALHLVQSPREVPVGPESIEKLPNIHSDDAAGRDRNRIGRVRVSQHRGRGTNEITRHADPSDGFLATGLDTSQLDQAVVDHENVVR